MAKKEFYALLMALLACLVWSGSFVIARGVHESIPPFALAFWRWVVALLVIIPIGYSHTKTQWQLIKSNWKFFVVIGILSVGIFNSIVYVAAHYTTTHHIAIISSTSPIWTLLLAGLLGIEKLSRYKVIGAVSAFIGALVIVTHGKLLDIFSIVWNFGDILLLISALVWAIYCVMLHYKPAGINPKALMLVIITIGTAFLLPFYGYEVLGGSTTPFTPKAVAAYLYLGIGSSIVSWFAWNYSIHTIGSVKTGLVYYTIPIFTSSLAILILGEPLEGYHWVGFILVFLGIVISNVSKIQYVIK